MSSRSTEDEVPPSKPDSYGLQAIQPVSGWWIFKKITAEGNGSDHRAIVDSVERIEENESAVIIIDHT